MEYFFDTKLQNLQLLFNTLPLNVLIVNVLGAFILGMFIILSEQWNLDGRFSLLAAIGFCGSLTTMSSFALDSSNLLDNRHYGTLVVNLLANVGLYWSINLWKIINDCYSKWLINYRDYIVCIL